MTLACGLLAVRHAAAASQPPCGYEVEFYIAPDCQIFDVLSWTAGIREDGTVVGHIDGCPDPNSTRAFVWWPDGDVTVISIPWSSAELAVSINAKGQVLLQVAVVGSGVGFVPAIWHEGDIQVLSIPEGSNQTDLASITSSGDVYGSWGNSVTGPFPLAGYWPRGELVDLTSLFAQPKQRVEGANDSGAFAGTAQGGPMPPSGDTRRAFYAADGEAIIIDVVPGCINSIGRALSSAGHVVGFGWSPARNTFPRKGFRWLAGEMSVLPPLPGDEETEAYGVNAAGVAVGRSRGDVGSIDAVAWFDCIPVELASMVQAMPVGSHLSVGLAITDSGIIAGIGSAAGAGPRAFRLWPIPPQQSDLDADCDVDAQDLACLLSNWGPDAGRTVVADLNDDDCVDGLDLGILLAEWTGEK